MYTHPADVSVDHEGQQSYVTDSSLDVFGRGSQISNRRNGIEASWLRLQLHMSRGTDLGWWALNKAVCGQWRPLLQKSLSSADHELQLLS